MLFLFRLATGYLWVELSGEYSEQIINLAAKNGITLWNLKSRRGIISCCMSISDFRRMRIIKRGTGVTIHITGKRGFPILAGRYRGRIGFALGMVMFFAVLALLSTRIWVINVAGNENVPSKRIIDACAELNIIEGVSRRGVDTYIQREKLLLSLPELAWASLNIEGSVLTVNVTEIKRDGKQENQPPCNLRSSADGIISRIDVTQGNPVVRVGDTVGINDLLVSGVVETMNSTCFVRAKGTVTAETRRTITVDGGYKLTRTIPTGRVKHRFVLSFFGIDFPLYVGRIKGGYEEKISVKPLRLFGSTLPVRITGKEFHITKEETVLLSREELCGRLSTELENKITELGIEKYEIVNQEMTENNDRICISYDITAHENIAFEDDIQIQNYIDDITVEDD